MHSESSIAIVGAGPAGIAAALQLGRYGLRPYIYERGAAGGLLHEAGRVGNYPGFPGGIEGPALARYFSEQLERAGIVPIPAAVTGLDHDGERFLLESADGPAAHGIVIIASGTRPLIPGNVSVDGTAAERVFSSIVALRNVRGGEIAIYGAGDAAFDYALTLSGANRVRIVARGAHAKCTRTLASACEKRAACAIEYGVTIMRVARRGDRLALDCRFAPGREPGEATRGEIEVDYLVTAVGREPELDFISTGLSDGMDKLVASGCLFVIGDVGNGIFRQTAISVGDGVRAGMEIGRRLMSEE